LYAITLSYFFFPNPTTPDIYTLSLHDALPIYNRTRYWNLDEETNIIFLLYKLLTHSKVQVRWQNGLYDAQYVWRHWHFVPRGGRSEEHTSELQSPCNLVCRLLLEKKKKTSTNI